MNTSTEYHIEHGTLATLPDAYALHTDREDAQRRLERFRARMAAGKARPEAFIFLRSGRGMEAVVLVGDKPRVPMFSHTRNDAAAAGLEQFYRYLRQHAPERLLVLDSNYTLLDAVPAQAAGWRLSEGEHLIYETDLRTRHWALAPEAQEGGPELLQRPDVAALLAELGQADWQPPAGWQVVVLPGADGQPAALGGVGPRDHAPTINISLIGVRPDQRGQGLGQRLHAHLLARAAELHDRHMGGTEASNAAMIRIFEANGSRLMARQLYLKAVED